MSGLTWLLSPLLVVWLCSCQSNQSASTNFATVPKRRRGGVKWVFTEIGVTPMTRHSRVAPRRAARWRMQDASRSPLL